MDYKAKKYTGVQGFTFLELLLVIGIIGVIAAVIVPRAIRINTSAKYTIVRQSAAELGKWGMEWAKRNLESQDPQATCVLNDYVATLTGFVGDPNQTNWVRVTNDLNNGCRNNTGGITYAVADIIDPEHQPRNPFNGLSYLATSGGNSGSKLTAGLLYLAQYTDQTTNPRTHHYYFLFTGTESKQINQWHGGMGSGWSPSLRYLKNGVFMARLVQ